MKNLRKIDIHSYCFIVQSFRKCFWQRWYPDDEIDPVVIKDRETIKEESVLMEYSFYRPFGEVAGEHVAGYYEVLTG